MFFEENNETRKENKNKENLPFSAMSDWNKGLFISAKSIPVSEIFPTSVLKNNNSSRFEFLENSGNQEFMNKTSTDLHSKENEKKTMKNDLCESSGNFDFNKKEQGFTNINCVDELAKMHKMSANYSNPNVSWSGVFPENRFEISASRFSQKIFVGGLPSRIREDVLKSVFCRFDGVNIFWPKKMKNSFKVPLGYAYVLFHRECSVNHLLSVCKQNEKTRNFFFKFSYKQNESEQTAEVQIIPWLQSDLFYQREPFAEHLFQKSVFVGALHGVMNARGLYQIMAELFGSVVSVEIDSDRYKYPIGSGKVIFCNKSSYLRAIEAGFVDVKCDKFRKKIQIDPYLEETYCERCMVEIGGYFCRNLKCLSYYCKVCWGIVHFDESDEHLPVTKAFY